LPVARGEEGRRLAGRAGVGEAAVPDPTLESALNVFVTPAMLGQVVISGILSGALYAMVALGLALIFGVMRIINVAHGPLLMLGPYTPYFLSPVLDVTPYLPVPVSRAVLFAVGVVLERTTPTAKRTAM